MQFLTICSSQVVVIFSKSGLGKSSLLNAGVSPLLTQLGYLPLNIRFSRTAEQGANPQPTSPVDILKTSLQTFAGKKEILFDVKQPRLWEFFKTCEFGCPLSPVLIFDQFEEFFHFPSNQIHDFLLQLSELVHDRVPSRISEWLLEIETEERTPEQMQWATQPAAKFVFAIRADRLFDLQKVDEIIPSVFNNRYELKPMSERNARAAIIEPAKQPAEGRFKSNPFTYKGTVLQKILDELKDKVTGEIECSQLQIICQSIEDRVKKALDNNQVIQEIDETVFDPEVEIDTALRSFYENQLAMIGSEDEVQLCRTVLEEYLISDDRRAPLLEGQIRKLLNNNDELLKKLLNARLIKIEITHLGTTFELSHDSLIDPILKSKQERKEKENKENEKIKALDEAASLIRSHYTCIQLNNIEQANEALRKAIDIYERYPDHLKGRVEARILAVKLYEAEDRTDKALEWLADTLAIANAGNDESLNGLVYEAFASVFEKQGNSDLSYDYYNKALGIYTEIPDFPQSARLSEHLGGINEELFNVYSAYDDDKSHLAVINESKKFYDAALHAYSIVGDLIGYFRTRRSVERIIKYINPWGYLTDLFAGETHELKGKSTIRLGRDVYDSDQQKYVIKNEIDVPNRFISRRHLTITPDFVVEDTQSTNGTTINSIPLIYGNPRVLINRDIIVLADVSPFLFTNTKPDGLEVSPDCWALICDGSSKTFYYLNGEAQAYSLFIRENPNTGGSQYHIDIEDDESENANFLFKLVDGQPHFKVNDVITNFADRLGTWKIHTKLKDVDRFYKEYLVNTGSWFPAMQFPMQPRLILKEDEKGEEKILADGPTFQFIKHPKFDE